MAQTGALGAWSHWRWAQLWLLSVLHDSSMLPGAALFGLLIEWSRNIQETGKTGLCGPPLGFLSPYCALWRLTADMPSCLSAPLKLILCVCLGICLLH